MGFQDFDETRYGAAIEAASLRDDLSILPGGDLVPMGTRGMLLSGGQCKRVMLARAAYNRSADVAIFDDPFSSVDAPTAKHIFEELLLGPFVKERTRVVVL